ncbi:MAG: prepilin-type N-terminal cleavage/methylation domain-containing protein [Clostridiales bacterium]|nr:prepilin-type N-terminal cleavage/methylation domain-containing protein [Clostridiales bacterium]MDY2721293.1 prepilin-type N-terminal cleavage/methylation domain-containing protein [Eubacteriales bacterium]
MRKVLKRLKLNKKGFTFAECIVAIALFAIVGTLAFTMFNTATRYMSKAKKEEAKRSQAQEQALLNTFMYNDQYIVYPHSILQVSYIRTTQNNVEQNVPQFAAVLNYDTDYGSVPFAISIEPTKVQATTYPIYPFTRYQVTSDKGTKRWIFIFNDDTVSYDLKNTQDVEKYSLSKDWVKDNYKS